MPLNQRHFLLGFVSQFLFQQGEIMFQLFVHLSPNDLVLVMEILLVVSQSFFASPEMQNARFRCSKFAE